MGKRRWPFVAECDVCVDHSARLLNDLRPRCAVYYSVREQLENCRESIELVLKQLSPVSSASTADGDEDIFSHGPQGAD